MGQKSPGGLPTAPYACSFVDYRMEPSVEFAGVLAGKHEVQIPAVDPVLFFDKVRLHAVVEGSPWQRIGDGDADFIRHAVADHRKRLFNIRPCFSWVAELEKEPDANSRCMKQPA